MTAQISDGFFHNGKEYYAIAVSKPIGFNPREYGLEPAAFATSCWRGHWCDYNITQLDVVLDKLHIRTVDDNYPEINGCKAIQDDKRYGCYSYTKLNLPMHYTGKLLLGDEFLQEYYVHMGFQSAWAFKIVKEFEFNDGKLIDIRDYSKTAEEFREMIDRDPEGFDKLQRENIPRFVDESFSQDYSIKAWWLEDG